jgi:divalent metal cation (Fe/Co/Zn/Cd) transporter
VSTDTTRTHNWGSAAVTTIAALIAACVGGGVGVALFWATTYSDPVAMAHTLVLFLIVTDIALMVLVSTALIYAYRRPS